MQEMMKGFSMVELMVAIGISTGVILVSTELLTKNTRLANAFNQSSDFMLLRENLQLRLSKSNGLESKCKPFFSAINFNNYALITDTSPATVANAQVPAELNLPIAFGRYNISSIRLFGADVNGLTTIATEGNSRTLRGELQVTLTKGATTEDLEPFDIIFNLNQATGELLDCSPLLFRQEVSLSVCNILGEDFLLDPGSAECLVPQYNCTPNLPANNGTLTGVITAPPAVAAPCAHVSLEEAFCDLELRSYVPGRSFCF